MGTNNKGEVRWIRKKKKKERKREDEKRKKKMEQRERERERKRGFSFLSNIYGDRVVDFHRSKN